MGSNSYSAWLTLLSGGKPVSAVTLTPMTFAFVSGHVALDFAGTVQHWRTDATDLLTDPGELARWFTEAGVVSEPVVTGAEELAQAVRLRKAVYWLMLATAEGNAYQAEDRRVLNGAAAVSPVRPRLTEDGSARWSGDADAALATVARAAIELLTGESRQLIRECGAEECTRLYVDQSARRSRRWCDMRGCGNRAKAQSFRKRHTAPAS
jgi:predicted RNA-binding Zn ribbon-like protein